MSEEEQIDLSLALDPSDGKIPEGGFDNYPTFTGGTFVEPDPELDRFLESPESRKCSVCSKIFGNGESQYCERGMYSGVHRVFCRECFDTHSEWAIIRKPILKERSKKARRCFIFTIIFVIFIILRALTALLEVLVNR